MLIHIIVGRQPSLHSRLLVLWKFDRMGQNREGFFWGGWGETGVPSPHVVPPGVLTLILLHVSPISTNGAAIVPPVVCSAQSP